MGLINWKLFWVLLVACIFGVVCVIPYQLTMQAGLLEELPIPIPLHIQIIQNVVMFAVLIFVGLYLAGKVGLGVPLLECWSHGMEIKGTLKAILGISILLGVLAVILTTTLDFTFYFMFPNEPIYAIEFPRPPAWQGFLASFYGAINEEVLNRLFLMNLLLWIFSKIGKAKGGKTREFTAWLVIILTAIIFGLMHLPTTATLVPITLFITARAIILNGIAGIIFGWLYWKKGLESAMISHFTADIIIHGILPMLVPNI
ncbi:MAG: CPBP family intramembrane glutamic endopeptidase [Candidatus Bathyarchaeia archaeon]